MICEDGRRSSAALSCQGLGDTVIFWRDKTRAEAEGRVEAQVW